MARILIIEDYADLANVLARYLEMVGHEVVAVARDGSSGVEASLKTRPNVAIVDMGLPDISGYEVGTRLRLEHPEPGMFLVAMTGCEAGWEPARALEAGFDDYLLKPLDHEALLALLAGFDAAESLSAAKQSRHEFEEESSGEVYACSSEEFSWAS